MSKTATVTQKFVAALVGLVLALGALAPALGMGTATVLAEEAYDVNQPPELSSAVGLLYDLDTGMVLFDQDSTVRRYPASITKVMTALLVLEHGNLDDTVTMESVDFEEVTVGSSTAGFQVGETVTVHDLMAGLMIPSGNEAAYALARYISGDWQSFVALMNARAAELGCADTHFANPCGLHDDENYSTARDLATIFEAALEYPVFTEIAGSATWDLPATNMSEGRTLETTVFLVDSESPVYEEGVYAAKTGFVDESGKCVIAAAQKDGMRLVAVVLGAANDPDSYGVTPNFFDAKSLFDWGFGAWYTGEVVRVGDALGMLSVDLSKDGEAVQGVSTDAIVATVPRVTTLADLTIDVESWDLGLTAPVEGGTLVSEAKISLGDRELGTVGIATAMTMRLSYEKVALRWLSVPENAAIVAAAAGAVVIVFVVALVVLKRRRAKRDA